MMVVSYNKMSINSNRTVNKLVIIRICRDDVELEIRCDEQCVGIVYNDIQSQRCKSSCCLTFKNLGIFCQYLHCDAKLIVPVEQRTPQIMVATATGNTLNQCIGVKNEAVHKGLPHGMKILVAHGVKLFLVQNPFVP